MRRKAAEPHLEDCGIYRKRWWAKVDGRQKRLRAAVGGSVVLGTATLAGSSSLFGWAYFNDRQNHLRDVAGEPVNPPRPLAH